MEADIKKNGRRSLKKIEDGIKAKNGRRPQKKREDDLNIIFE